MTAQLKLGYAPLYRPGTACPGCGASQWTVGRISAECVFCCTALPLAPVEAPRAAIERLPAWTRRL